MQVLRQLPFLRNIDKSLFNRLLQRGQLVKYTRGEVIWRPPTPGAASLTPSLSDIQNLRNLLTPYQT